MGPRAATRRLAPRWLRVLHLLDSTVLIDFLRGRPAVRRVQLLRAVGDVPGTTAINVEEIVRGLRVGEHDAARRLFDGLVIVSITDAEGWQAGLWRREAAARGVTLWQADCLIAAAAAGLHAVLATGNPKDFPMAGVAIEHWPVGE